MHPRRDLGIELQLPQIYIIICFLSPISRYDNFKVDLIPCNFYNDVTSTWALRVFFLNSQLPHDIHTYTNIMVIIKIDEFGCNPSTKELEKNSHLAFLEIKHPLFMARLLRVNLLWKIYMFLTNKIKPVGIFC